MFVIPQLGSFITSISNNPVMVVAPVAVLMALQFLLGAIEEQLNPNPKKKKKRDGKESESAEISETAGSEFKIENNENNSNSIDVVVDDKLEQHPEEMNMKIEKEGEEIEENENNGD